MAHARIRDIAKAAFTSHAITSGQPWRSLLRRRVQSATWRIAQPGTSTYAFRVTWTPYNITITGDLGSITYCNHSLDTLWSAVAWVNGASHDYMTSKASARKEYDAEATASHIVERIYEELRGSTGQWAFADARSTAARREKARRSIYDSPHYHTLKGPLAWLEAIGETEDCEDILAPANAFDRKAAIRAWRDSEPSEQTIYDMTRDGEMLSYRYPRQTEWQHAAAQLWARLLLDAEPRWSRCYRQVRSEWRDFRRTFARADLYWHPILYRRSGRRDSYTPRYWRWDKGQNGRSYYEGLRPLVWKGVNFGRLGLWRKAGMGQSENLTTWPGEVADSWVPLSHHETIAASREVAG